MGRGEEEQTKFGPKGEGVGTTESKITEGTAGANQTGNASSVLISDIRAKKPEIFNLKPENSAPPASDWVYALKDVSFEVKRGEILGIIGRNGAGKSTLLKILSRVTTQSSGQIKRRGRLPQAGPEGFANRVESTPNFDRGRGLGGGRRGIPKNAWAK